MSHLSSLINLVLTLLLQYNFYIMAKEIAITHLDLESLGGINNVNITCLNPEDPNSYQSENIPFTDLSTSEQTLLNACLTMLSAKITVTTP